MAEDYDVGQIRRLEAVIEQAELFHRHKPSRYDAGHVFNFEITGVCPATVSRAKLEVERFVGGGFAGQVYRVRLLELDMADGAVPGL